MVSKKLGRIRLKYETLSLVINFTSVFLFFFATTFSAFLCAWYTLILPDQQVAPGDFYLSVAIVSFKESLSPEDPIPFVLIISTYLLCFRIPSFAVKARTRFTSEVSMAIYYSFWCMRYFKKL